VNRQRVQSGSPYEESIGFCRALKHGSRILVSGTAALDPDGNSVGENDPGLQMRRCLEIGMEAIVALGGLATDVVRTRIYLTRPEDWPLVAAVHGEYFGQARPVATCVIVQALLRTEWLVEVELEALVGDQLRLAPLAAADRAWLRLQAEQLFGADFVVSRGVSHRPAELDGVVARQSGEPVGVATFRIEENECELVTIDAKRPGQGVGTALLAAVEEIAVRRGCLRVWLVTTNDNLEALRFYQRRGYELSAVHVGAVNHSRELKPAIPLVGNFGIPIRDELELQKRLAAD
jgi:enamine deaminase RidA (YjgF/YER057c/UK114 family)/RimJ/RimL family protein N-acetyltransferase